jgi:hypothetical protein
MIAEPNSPEEAQAQMALIQAEYVKSVAELIKSLWGVYLFSRQCKAITHKAKFLNRSFGVLPSMNLIRCAYFEGTYSHVDLETISNLALIFFEEKFPGIFRTTKVMPSHDRKMFKREIRKISPTCSFLGNND